MAESEPGSTGAPGDLKPADGQIARAGDPEIVPLDLSPEQGLRPATYRDLFEGVANRFPAVADFLRAFGRDAQWRLEEEIRRGDALQDRLADERVAHARTDERLRTGQLMSGAHAFLQVIGGAFLGYGFGRLDSPNPWIGVGFIVPGVVMIAAGCWPVLSVRWRQGSHGRSND